MHEVALGLLLHSTYQVHKQYIVPQRTSKMYETWSQRQLCQVCTAAADQQQRADGTQRRGSSMLASDVYVIVITDIDLVAVDVVPELKSMRATDASSG